MPKSYALILGKAVKYAAGLRGGGSALPGLFVEKIDPDFLKRTLSTLPRGVVLISGTNGKTTTTKMVVELLESQGLKVFTNRTGSNFTRGVAAALLGAVDSNGNLDADIAVLELDEAHAVHFVRAIPPTHCLLLNVMRDQLDRFGEIDATAKLLKTVADATEQTVAINREDPRLIRVASSLTAKNIVFFGLDESLRKLFPSDDELRGSVTSSVSRPDALVTLKQLDGQTATFTIDNRDFTRTLKLDGVYNVFNAAAALSLVASIVGDELNHEVLFDALGNVTPAFGRGEKLLIRGQPCELVLVKNPSGFRLGLSSFTSEGYATMIAINDNYADGRDMSWLWDVEFDSLSAGVAAVTGVRAYDMALRLQYDEITIQSVESDLKKALSAFVKAYPDQPKRIYCTYTAMLALRRELSKMTAVEKIT